MTFCLGGGRSFFLMKWLFLVCSLRPTPSTSSVSSCTSSVLPSAGWWAEACWLQAQRGSVGPSTPLAAPSWAGRWRWAGAEPPVLKGVTMSCSAVRPVLGVVAFRPHLPACRSPLPLPPPCWGSSRPRQPAARLPPPSAHHSRQAAGPAGPQVRCGELRPAVPPRGRLSCQRRGVQASA